MLMELIEYSSFPPTRVYYLLVPLRHHSGNPLVFAFCKTVERLIHILSVVLGFPVKLRPTAWSDIADAE